MTGTLGQSSRIRLRIEGLSHGRPADPDKVVEAYRRKRTQIPGLENTLRSMEEIDHIRRRDFTGKLDWRDTSDE